MSRHNSKKVLMVYTEQLGKFNVAIADVLKKISNI